MFKTGAHFNYRLVLETITDISSLIIGKDEAGDPGFCLCESEREEQRRERDFCGKWRFSGDG